MREKFKRMTEALIALYVIMLPWQTVYIANEQFVGGIKSQYLTGVFYASEIILFLAVACSIINWPMMGGLKNIRSRLYSPTTDKNRRRFIFTLWLLLGYLSLSVIWSDNRAAAAFQLRYFFEGAALFLIILNERISPNTIFTALFMSGILPAALAAYQFIAQDISAFKWLGLAAHSAADSGSIVIEAGGRWLRAYGPFAHPNVLGGWLSLSFISGLILLSYGSLNTNLRRAVIFISPLIVAGVFFSFSRSAWLALMISVGLFMYLNRGYFRLDKLKGMIYYPAPQIFYSLLFFILLSFIFSPLVLSRAGSFNRLENRSSSERISQTKEAIRIIAEQPLAGVGLNSHTAALSEKFSSLNAYDLQPVHNVYLLIASELGLIGLIIFIYLIYSAVRIMRKNETPSIHALPLLMLLAIGLFDHYPYSSYIGIIASFIALALMLRSENSLTDKLAHDKNQALTHSL